MCLEKLSDFKVKLGENGVGIGWKVFEKDQFGRLYGEIVAGRRERKEGKWLKERDFRLFNSYRKLPTENEKESYKMGFHVFLTRYGAKKWEGTPIRKIKFRKVVARGLQMDCRCVVAKEIFIPKEA